MWAGGGGGSSHFKLHRLGGDQVCTLNTEQLKGTIYRPELDGIFFDVCSHLFNLGIQRDLIDECIPITRLLLDSFLDKRGEGAFHVDGTKEPPFRIHALPELYEVL